MINLSHTFYLSIRARHRRLLGRRPATSDLTKGGLNILVGFRFLLFLLATEYLHHTFNFHPAQAIPHLSRTHHGTCHHMASKVLDTR
jgi:hypothetical protein